MTRYNHAESHHDQRKGGDSIDDTTTRVALPRPPRPPPPRQHQSPAPRSPRPDAPSAPPGTVVPGPRRLPVQSSPIRPGTDHNASFIDARRPHSWSRPRPGVWPGTQRPQLVGQPHRSVSGRGPVDPRRPVPPPDSSRAAPLAASRALESPTLVRYQRYGDTTATSVTLGFFMVVLCLIGAIGIGALVMFVLS